jgi:rhodanese-related sulfurtransferase
VEAQQAVYRKISAAEAYKMMSELPDYTILDVRTVTEYKEQRIAQAILIPDNEIERLAERELPDKKKVILVYCRSGRRSEKAARELANMGYINVYDFGGILQWPYETASDKK